MFPSMLTALAHPVCPLTLFPPPHRVIGSLTNYDYEDLWKPAKISRRKCLGEGHISSWSLCNLSKNKFYIISPAFFHSRLPLDHGRKCLGEGHIWSWSICNLWNLLSFYSGLPPDLQSWVLETWMRSPARWMVYCFQMPAI